MTTKNTMLMLDDISKSYQKNARAARGQKSGASPATKAVDGLSLDIAKGEIFGFLGPNGAGKTTTIRMITGILRPDAGRVAVDGVDMRENPVEAKRKIGFVPDVHEVYDRLTGLEYLNFTADIYGVDAPTRQARMGPLLEEYEMRDAVGQPIRSYSHGMKQKILLISALLHHPPLWVLDEPMTGLDPKAAHALKERMRQHCDQGNTVFFSTHVLDVAEKICDRVGIVNNGRLVAVGTLSQLRREAGESLESLFLQLTE